MTMLTVLLLNSRKHPAEQYFPAFRIKQRQRLEEKKNRAFFVYLFW